MKAKLDPIKKAATSVASNAIREVVRALGVEGKAKLMEPVSNWVHRPTFRHYTRVWPNRVTLTFTVRDTDPPLWTMVNYGTTEHSIYPRGPWPLRLRFRPAKTVPNSFRYRKRRPVTRIIYRMYVRSQAITPRRWDAALVRFLVHRARRLGQKELARALGQLGTVTVRVKTGG